MSHVAALQLLAGPKEAWTRVVTSVKSQAAAILTGLGTVWGVQKWYMIGLLANLSQRECRVQHIANVVQRPLYHLVALWKTVYLRRQAKHLRRRVCRPLNAELSQN